MRARTERRGVPTPKRKNIGKKTGGSRGSIRHWRAHRTAILGAAANAGPTPRGERADGKKEKNRLDLQAGGQKTIAPGR